MVFGNLAVQYYRPISLLSVISKCMERCVYKYVYNFLLPNNIITSNQSGFTFGDSAINQLVNVSNDFGRALDSGKEIRGKFGKYGLRVVKISLHSKEIIELIRLV
jgi:hypothetical protein